MPRTPKRRAGPACKTRKPVKQVESDESDSEIVNLPKRSTRAGGNRVTSDNSIKSPGKSTPQKKKGGQEEKESKKSTPRKMKRETIQDSSDSLSVESSYAPSEDVKPVTAPAKRLLVTVKKCMLCDIVLTGSSKIHWSEELTTKFNAFCTFFDIELDDTYKWDHQQENYPFCLECTFYLDYMHTLYTHLEQLHGNVAQGVKKVMQVVSKIQKEKASQEKPEYRVRFIRRKIMSSFSEMEENEPIELPPLNELQSSSKSVDKEKKNSCCVATQTSKPVEIIKADAGQQCTDEDLGIVTEAPPVVEQEEVEFHSCNEDNDEESEDEFQAFIEEELVKRKAAALRAQAAYTPLTPANPVNVIDGSSDEEQPETHAPEMQMETEEPVEQAHIVTSGDIDEYVDEKPDVDHLEEEPEFSGLPRRSIRSKKRVKYSKDEYHVGTDEEDLDEDFDIADGDDSGTDFDSDSDFGDTAQKKRARRQRKRTRPTKGSNIATAASDPLACGNGELQATPDPVQVDGNHTDTITIEAKPLNESENVIIVESLRVMHDASAVE